MQAIKPAKNMNDQELLDFLELTNFDYRQGDESVPDLIYDEYKTELVSRLPDHPLLAQVEEEPDFGKGLIRHKKPMLSTDKVYTVAEVEKYINRCKKSATELGMGADSIQYRLTPKLDGWSANDEGGVLATRGDHIVGNDVSHIYARGVVPVDGRDQGVGEIVIAEKYWAEYLVDEFPSPRNVLQGVIKAEQPNVYISAALQAKAVRFVPYCTLDALNCDGQQLLGNVEAWCEKIENESEYPTDGVVIEVIDEDLKAHMGSASDHHHWMVAKKVLGETAIVGVLDVIAQTGRTGRVTPVIKIPETFLSNCNINSITAHHFGIVKAMNIGVGAKIKIVRAGKVIPKFLGIVEAGEAAKIPSHCPSCNHPLEWEKNNTSDDKYLKCFGNECMAQIENRLLHFFHILGNINEFGPVTIRKLVESGYDSLPAIYELNVDDFIAMAFGPKQSQNLVNELLRSTRQEVDDWRFLAAFGIHFLGRGSSRKLLEVHPLTTLGSITMNDIHAIKGFGDITAPAISDGLTRKWPLIEEILSYNFKLRITEKVDAVENPIKGKNIVFTGTMSNSREEMKTLARELGATVQSGVNKKTDFLIIGERVGEKKIESAKKNGTEILTEQEYCQMLQDD